MKGTLRASNAQAWDDPDVTFVRRPRQHHTPKIGEEVHVHSATAMKATEKYRVVSISKCGHEITLQPRTGEEFVVDALCIRSAKTMKQSATTKTCIKCLCVKPRDRFRVQLNTCRDCESAYTRGRYVSLKHRMREAA